MAVSDSRQAGAYDITNEIDVITKSLMDSPIVDGDYVCLSRSLARDLVEFVLLAARSRSCPVNFSQAAHNRINQSI